MAVSFKLNKINKKHLSNIVIVTVLISLVLRSENCLMEVLKMNITY